MSGERGIRTIASRVEPGLRNSFKVVRATLRGLAELLATRDGLLLLLGLYGMLSFSYMINIPVLESPDESSHLQVIRYIRRFHKVVPYQLPPRRADTGASMAWLIGYHDPPLYYAPPLYHSLAALLTWWTTMPDLPARLIPSPSWEAGYAPQRGAETWNKNVFIHLPDENLLGSPTVRAAWTLRVFSITLGGLTIWTTYRLALSLWPGAYHRALASAAVLTFNPQFLALHSSVSNDPLVIALCSLTLLALVHLIQHHDRWYAWIIPGLLLGLGVLTKQSALLLVPVVGVATFLAPTWTTGRADWRESLRRLLRRNLAWGTSVFLLGGWWYIEQAVCHDDLLGVQPHFAAQVALRSFGLQEMYATWQSYWGAFGWTLLTIPAWFLVLVTGLGIVALLGLGCEVMRGKQWAGQKGGLTPVIGLLAGSVVVGLFSFVSWATRTGSAYGRLLFPTIAAQAVLVVTGLAWWRDRWFRCLLGVIAGIVSLSALLFPWFLIRPAFASPYRPGGVPHAAQLVETPCDLPVCLRGFETLSVPRRPGDTLELVLYWQATQLVAENWVLSAQLAGPDPTRRVAEDTRWLGGTLFPTAYWRPGDVVAHEVTLEVPRSAAAPSIYWLRVAVVGPDGHLLPYNTKDDRVALGPWPLRLSARVPSDATFVGATFGGAIELQAVDIGIEEDEMDVTLYWACKQSLGQDLTVFVHLVDDRGLLVAQHDAPPVQTAFPTSWWRKGDVVPDRHELILPEGVPTSSQLYLRVGLYELETGRRWSVVDAAGRVQPDGALSLKLP